MNGENHLTGTDVIVRKVLPFMAHLGRGMMITLGTWLAMNGSALRTMISAPVEGASFFVPS